MQSDIFGTGITTINSSEGPALGVAILAGVGTGIYDSVPQACDAIIKVKTRQAADMKLNEIYARYYSIYKQLYKSLKQDFADLASVLQA
jgi:xylulokinase